MTATMTAPMRAAWRTSCAIVRKINRARRFNRAKAMRPWYERTRGYWGEYLDALFSYMAKHEGWAKLQRHAQTAAAHETFTKASMTEADRNFLADLLASFGRGGDAEIARKAAEIIEACAIPTFEEAAKFALRQLGVASSDFELRNEAVRELLMERQAAAVFASRTFMEGTFSAITNYFYDLGRHPFDQEALDELRAQLGYKADWEAKRFALTETGIASELAQAETYRRNGVGAKQWNALDVNSRPSHLALDQAVVKIEQKFNCGGFPADHPLDPKLPPSELVNCHCWLSPVVDDSFEIDPESVWEGQ